MKRFVLSGLAVLAAATAFAAQAQPMPGGKCIYVRDLRNHTVGDDHTLYFNLAGRDIYRVTASNACLAGVTSTDPIVLRDRASTGRICDRMDWDIGVHGARCIVSDVSRLTPDEVKALPRGVKPYRACGPAPLAEGGEGKGAVPLGQFDVGEGPCTSPASIRSASPICPRRWSRCRG